MREYRMVHINECLGEYADKSLWYILNKEPLLKDLNNELKKANESLSNWSSKGLLRALENKKLREKLKNHVTNKDNKNKLAYMWMGIILMKRENDGFIMIHKNEYISREDIIETWNHEKLIFSEEEVNYFLEKEIISKTQYSEWKTAQQEELKLQKNEQRQNPEPEKRSADKLKDEKVAIIKEYIRGKISDEEFNKNNIPIDKIGDYDLSAEELIMLANKNTRYREKVLLELSMKQYSKYSQEHVDDILSMYKDLIIERIQGNKWISQGLISSFNKTVELINGEDKEDKAREYFENLMSDLRKINKQKQGKKEEESIEELVKLVEAGILPQQYLKIGISTEEIENLCLVNENELICKLFNFGTITPEELSAMFWDYEIVDKVKEGKLNINALMAVSHENRQLGLESNKNIGKADIIKLYLDYGMQLDELKGYLQTTDNVCDLIPESASSEKIKELYLNGVISQDNLFHLEERQVVTKEEKTKIENSFNSLEAFKQMFEVDENLKRESTEIMVKDNQNAEQQELKQSYILPVDCEKEQNSQYGFLKSFGTDVRTIKIKQCIHNPLAGYQIYGLKDKNAVVCVSNDAEHAYNYVMTIPSFYYYFKQIQDGKENNEVKINRSNNINVFKMDKNWKDKVKGAIEKINENPPQTEVGVTK